MILFFMNTRIKQFCKATALAVQINFGKPDVSSISQEFKKSQKTYKPFKEEPKIIIDKKLDHVDSQDSEECLRIEGKKVFVLGRMVGVLQKDDSIELISGFDQINTNIFEQIKTALIEEAKNKKDPDAILNLMKHYEDSSSYFDFSEINWEEMINAIPKYFDKEDVNIYKQPKEDRSRTVNGEEKVEKHFINIARTINEYLLWIDFSREDLLIGFCDRDKSLPTRIFIKLQVKNEKNKKQMRLYSWYAPEFKEKHSEIMNIIYKNIVSNDLEKIKESIKHQEELSEWKAIRDAL